MKKICLFLIATAIACNDGAENNATTDTTQADSSLHMNDGTVNADTIDKRTDARQDRVLDSLR